MAETIRSMGQALPAANTLTNLFTVAAAKAVVVSSVVVCNQDTQPVEFDIAHALAGAADSAKQYLYYRHVVPARKTFAATLGVTLAVGDILRVRSNNGLTSFNVYGSEVTV